MMTSTAGRGRRKGELRLGLPVAARFAERDHKNIVSWHVDDKGSHFATHGAPDLLVSDIRGYVRQLH